MGDININPIEIADDIANGEANSPAALLARNAILEARLKEAEGERDNWQEAYTNETARVGKYTARRKWGEDDV